jgi:hypothetical protein
VVCCSLKSLQESWQSKNPVINPIEKFLYNITSDAVIIDENFLIGTSQITHLLLL